ncbi:MAG: hypothetical protein ACJ749_14510 [Flavisolibacter sp.]
MSRIFTTPFVFQDKEYLSLVSVKKTEHKPVYTIRIFDQRLIDIIGNDIVESIGYEGYLQKAHFNLENPAKLMSCIMTAIRQHMERSSQTPAG